MLSVKQNSIKYHFLSLWYDSTWDWTPVSRTLLIWPMAQLKDYKEPKSKLKIFLSILSFQLSFYHLTFHIWFYFLPFHIIIIIIIIEFSAFWRIIRNRKDSCKFNNNNNNNHKNGIKIKQKTERKALLLKERTWKKERKKERKNKIRFCWKWETKKKREERDNWIIMKDMKKVKRRKDKRKLYQET